MTTNSSDLILDTSSPKNDFSSISLTEAKESTPPSPTNTSSVLKDDKEEQEFITDSSFWLVFLSLCVASFLSALDLTAVSTVLPTIAEEFQSNEYSYIGSVYALTSTAFIPWTSGLAAIFGRKSTMMGSLAFFAVGSVVVASSASMGALLAGRALQGVGGGGILTMSEIVICDMIPLAKRGAYFGVLGAVWAISSAIGPSLGGAFASAHAWRWLFWMNLPISVVAAVLVACFMNLKSPERSWEEKLAMMDYVNILFVVSATSAILGLTWAGDGGKYTWTSAWVLAPLICGLAGMILFFFIEKNYVKHPTVPFDILTHPTSILGYFTTFLHGMVSMAAIYYFPAFFQSVKNATPLQAGVDLFSLSFTIAPLAIIAGAVITITKNYKITNIVCWATLMIGFGLCTLLGSYSNNAECTGFVVIIGLGLGMGYASINFPVLAPLTPGQQPAAVTFLAFSRSFGQVCGIAIPGTILNNALGVHLPLEFIQQVGGSASGAFAAIPTIKYLPEPLQSLVHDAFSDSLRPIWWCSLGLSTVGLIASCFMKEIKMGDKLEASEWGIKREKSQDIESIEGE